MHMVYQARFVRILASVLLLFTGCINATSITAHISIVDQIAQELARESPNNSIEQIPFQAFLLDTVLSKRLDARLIQNNPHIQGTDLHFTLPYTEHAVAVLTLTYPSHAIALRQSEWLAELGQSGGQYLRNTKVMALFTYAVVDETLVILFTEQQRYVTFIENFANTLKSRTGNNLTTPTS